MKTIKKILYVIPSTAGGGIEKLISEYGAAFTSVCCSVDVLSFNNLGDKEFKDFNNVYFLGDYGKRCKTIELRLKLFFNEHSDYDVVHSNVHMHNGLVLKNAKKKGVKVCISHIHTNGGKCSNIVSLLYNKMKNCVLRYMIDEYSDYKIACSRESGYLAYRSDKFLFLPNGIDVVKYRFNKEERLRLRKSLNIAESTIVFMHVGRFSPEKNHTFLLNVFNEYIKLCPNSLLLIFGDGLLRNDILNDIERMQLIEKVNLMGYCDNLYLYYQVADIFLLPSLFEGFPVSIVEAQASGMFTYISDTITDEVVITDKVSKMSLKDSPMIWAKSMPTVFNNSKRENYYLRVQEKKFDKYDTFQILSSLYGI